MLHTLHYLNFFNIKVNKNRSINRVQLNPELILAWYKCVGMCSGTLSVLCRGIERYQIPVL